MTLLILDPGYLFGMVGVLGSVVAVWVSLEKKITGIDTRLRAVEKQDDRIMVKLDEISDWQEQQFDKLRDKLTELELKIEQKANK